MQGFPPALIERLRTNPDDRETLAILADWFEEHGAVDEASWLLDHLHGMAGLFRAPSTGTDPMGGIDPDWLTVRNGLVVALRVPEGRDRMAEGTCRVLSTLPLALAITTVQIRHGQAAAAWLPQVARHLPGISRLQLAADVPPTPSVALRGLRTLEWVDLGRAEGTLPLGDLDALILDVRGGQASLLDVLDPTSLARLELRGQPCDPEAVARFVRVNGVASVFVETGGGWLVEAARNAGLVHVSTVDGGALFTR